MATIYGVRYAYGTRVIRAAIPSSAFSEGDILMYDSNSSLSRIPATFASGVDIAGVALSASTASYQNKVSYIIPMFDTVFMSECTIGSQFTAGEEHDFEYTSARFMLSSSTNSVRAVVLRGTADISQSQRSQCLIQFISNAGNLEHS